MDNQIEDRVIAKIYVDKTVYHFDKAFDYLVPCELIPFVKRGMRVIVPFGNGNSKRQGMVYELYKPSNPTKKLKQVLQVLDEKAVFTEEMFKIADFMCDNTFCTFYDAVKTILPNGANMVITEKYSLNKSIDEIDFTSLNEKEQNLVNFIKTAKTARELDDFLSCNKSSDKHKVVASLTDKGIIKVNDTAKTKVSAKTEKMVRLTDSYLLNGTQQKLSPKQAEIVDFLTNVITASEKEVMYFCALGKSVIKGLVKKNVAEYYDKEVYRIPESEHAKTLNVDEITLSEKQKRVYEGLLNKLNENTAQVSLLYGVTGSGKTQIFVKLIDEVLKKGKQAMMLVPEISLTPQLVEGFKGMFGDLVAVLHSSLSMGERLDEFKRIQDGKASIVIGTRSAVFAPCSNLGLIVMDEEGEGSYKSESSPRYHARDIAKLRCVNHNAMLLLASATPSIDSFYRAKKGIYNLFELNERYAGALLPEVYVVDMKAQEKKLNTSLLSDVLKQEIENNLNKNEQTILFINRRGYNTIACCMECGEVKKCPNCDVALTYHKDNGYMMCHYCGYAEKFKRHCDECDSEHIKLSGVGTQRLEDELQLTFPKAKILRMDTDTTTSRYAYGKMFADFKDGEYDILVGTQMIAKGLNFPNVTLVGVMNVDGALYSGDFKGVERVFSLITQVVGRSGRADKTGRAYIQTLMPDNQVISLAAKQDYKGFFEDEIATRQAMLYPPFCDICVVNVCGEDEKKVVSSAKVFMGMLRKNVEAFENKVPLKVLGPIKPVIYRMNGKYRLKIIIKCRFNSSFKRYLKTCLIEAGTDKRFGHITVYTDINGDIES